jgi:hypothetical protein
LRVSEILPNLLFHPIQLGRRIKGILLLSVLISPVLITYYWLEYKKSLVKHEIQCRMMQGVHNDELILLKFTREESETKLRWEHPGEFEYNRQMYDVAKTRVRGDTLYFWCFWDHGETRLNREIAELVTKAFKNDPQQREKHQRLQSFFKSLYCSDLLNWRPIAPSPGLKGPCIGTIFLPSLSFPPPKPPPRLS